MSVLRITVIMLIGMFIITASCKKGKETDAEPENIRYNVHSN
ncbi:MAG: hypothetical protein JWQ25_269, partial [Daejeonella sp.]|nr:hypothetical protein [Daejeonella sp.]